MPRIIDYDIVARRMADAGFVCLYHNSGAFGFARGVQWKMLGWIGPDDPSIRPDARPFIRNVPPPHAANLAGMFIRARARAILGGEAWLMPKSHWHFELHDGHPDLLTALLPEIGIDPAILRPRNDGSAIAFAADEHAPLRLAVERLLGDTRPSDFLLAFPDAGRTLCTVHHHTQLWWQTADAAVADALSTIEP